MVGILNITPDSFSDGNQFLQIDAALDRARKLFSEGAALVDVGGEATNPWAAAITWEEEWRRIEAVVTVLLKEWPGRISLDTRHAQTAAKFLEAGGKVVNDVSGFLSPQMIKLAVKHQPVCIINHFPGHTPKEVHQVQIDDVRLVREDLLNKYKELVDAGVNKDQIVLDPGIGFGKTMRLNRELLGFAKEVSNLPVMIGYSRKRFLGEKRFEIRPNLEAAEIAIRSGAAYLRVHDVAATVELLNTLS